MKNRCLIFILILSIGCSADYSNMQMEAVSEKSSSLYKEEKELKIETDKIKDVYNAEKLIRLADLELEVQQYSKSIKGLRTIIANSKGTIVSENERINEYSAKNNLEIRVNANYFDSLIIHLCENVFKTHRKIISTDDVTAEFIDAKSRIETKKQVQEKYKQLLKGSKNVNELLMVEEKLRVIQEEIEARQARLNYLSERVKYSTINLSILENYDQEAKRLAEQPGFGTKIGKGFDSGWSVMLSMIIALTYLWPIWIVLIILFILWKKRFRKTQPS